MTDSIEQVVSSGICIGCGGCAFAAGGRMSLDEFGFFKPVLESNTTVKQSMACPFLAPKLDEDMLAERFLPATPNRDHKIGKYEAVFAAHAAEGDFRRNGSSGGLGSWIGSEMLRKGLIDGVIHARPVPRTLSEDPFFRYGISRSVEELTAASHSHYHVIEISEVLEEVRTTPGRYLFVGIPCMVKAVRRAQLQDVQVAERIVFTIGLVCGHLKSVHWALSLGWGAGTNPDKIDSITFRVKSENVAAKSYFFGIQEKGGTEQKVFDSAPLTGGKFNLGAMMPEACNYCDDVVGETADLTIGDAWLPRYSFDWRGKNMVISRNPAMTALFNTAQAEGRVSMDTMTAREAAEAQAGGFRQRREGLAYRLARRKANGHWTPIKRDLPDMTSPGPLRAQIYDMRERIAKQSQSAFRKALDQGDITIYDEEMAASFKRLRRVELFVALIRIISVRLRSALSRKRS